MKKRATEPNEELPAISESHEMAKVIPIRTETVLSQYPIHKLSKDKRPVQIRFTTEGKGGRVETTWKVSPNAEYGHPGELAYKLDTLVINRLFDDLHPNVPEVIKIADSLRELSELIGKKKTGNTTEIKNALYQNAFAAITARLEFTGNDQRQRSFEFGSTRYGIVFIGERLPNGKTADAIFIVLNPLYRDVLRHAKRRPLDYAYLQALPPSSQRLYELIAPQIYAALKNENPRAKYLYSEFCQRSTLTRYQEWDRIKKQLYKVHKPHFDSGYLKAVEFEETIDAAGEIDWVMWYTPGRKAKTEFKRFNTKEGRELDRQPRPRPHLVTVEVGQQEGNQQNKKTSLIADNVKRRMPEDLALIEKLMSYGIDESRAARLIESDRAECELWAAAWPHQNQKGMENPPAVLASFIEKKRRPLPKGYKEALEHKERNRQYEQEQRRAVAEESYFRFFEPQFRAFQKAELERIEESQAEAFKEFKTWFDKNHAKGLRLIESETRREEVRTRRAAEFFAQVRPGLEIRLTSFDEWDEQHNAEKCDPMENQERVFKALCERE
jgi:hypothetical protein